MKVNPYMVGYSQSDIEKLYTSASISPRIDSYANLAIQNVKYQMYSSSITIPLTNVIYNSTKVETAYDVNFNQL